ncbi:hypothetical protein [Pseudomonas citronellolis]|uniref:hypothetical protein n=1 Tax=Pseudomonas citronellolis TaxID=53408 RepID=UPI00248E22F2|nr:hypothetical protein [Pseudomonas citronellolis]
MAKNPVSDELFPRHVRALARAVEEAEAWRGSMVGNPNPGPLEAFDKFIKEAKQAMRIVRELGRQHAAVRRHRTW